MYMAWNGDKWSVQQRSRIALLENRITETSFDMGDHIRGGNNDVSGRFTSSTDAAARRSITIPSLIVAVSGEVVFIPTELVFDLNSPDVWDAPGLAVPSARAGKDFYVYATTGSDTQVVLSENATFPTGYTASNTRKIGGFHCLCVSVGIISGHELYGYIAGDALPRSCWDLSHLPVSSPEGMVYSPSGHWVDIYLPSVAGGQLVSVNGGTIADGVSVNIFHAYKYDQWFARIGKKPIASMEFVVASIGANQGTNIMGSVDPVTTTGHIDTAGRRMISNIGCEDMCGVLWQFGREQGGSSGADSWVSAYDANDSNVAGQHYRAPNRPRFGGAWYNGAECGSRGSYWNGSPLALASSSSSRGVAEPASSR